MSWDDLKFHAFNVFLALCIGVTVFVGVIGIMLTGEMR